ncbi:MAG: hypothetical protein ACD_19C00146G0002 [uncultured bacterium]|nr:MAG: hypothetical protein ACD_19C00146G0002 [uncultured bacterium]
MAKINNIEGRFAEVSNKEKGVLEWASDGIPVALLLCPFSLLLLWINLKLSKIFIPQIEDSFDPVQASIFTAFTTYLCIQIYQKISNNNLSQHENRSLVIKGVVALIFTFPLLSLLSWLQVL